MLILSDQHRLDAYSFTLTLENYSAASTSYLLKETADYVIKRIIESP